MLLRLSFSAASTPTPTVTFSPIPTVTPTATLTPSPSPTPSPTPSTTLTPHAGDLVLWLVVVGIIAVGLIIYIARKWLKGSQDDQAATFIRSWIAVSLVLGLLIFCAAVLVSTNTSLQSTLFGGLIASTGAAVAFYFSSKSADQARADILNAVTAVGQGGTAPSAFSAISPPAGTHGNEYTYRIVANGQPAPLYQTISGNLPTGLILGTDGTLTGTPTVPGPYTFQIAAFNSSGLLTSPQITITIA
jgi:hypothetical protein